MNNIGENTVIPVEKDCLLKYELIAGVLHHEGEEVKTYGILLLKEDNCGNIINIKRYEHLSSIKETALELIRRFKMHCVTPEQIGDFVEEFIKFPGMF